MSYKKRSGNSFHPRKTIEARKLMHGDVTFHSNAKGNTPLHWAIIKSYDLDSITTLLNKVNNIHVKNNNQDTPLHIAIQLKNTEAALLLIKKGALVGENLNSLLLMAIKKKDYTIFKILIDYGIQYNSLTDMKIFLNAAISQNHPKMIEYIIPHCRFLKPSDKYIPKTAVTRTDPQSKECLEILLKWNFTINPNSLNQNLIYSAVEKGYLPIVSLLLKFKINVNMVNSRTKFTLLTIACLKKHYEIIEILLQHNANVSKIIHNKNRHIFKNMLSRVFDKKDLKKMTCLHIAVLSGNQKMTELLLRYCAKKMNVSTLFNVTRIAVHENFVEIVRILLDHGVKVTGINRYEETLLHVCLYSYYCDNDIRYNMAKMLLDKGAHVLIQTPNNSLVFDAIENRNPEVTQLFLDYNADVQYIDINGHTILHQAIAAAYDVEFIKTLLKLNPSVNTKNYCWRTPLFEACDGHYDNPVEIIEILLHYNADIHCTDCSLTTPLHLACKYQNIRLVEFLLANGVNPHASDRQGDTALHFCSMSRCGSDPKIMSLLLEHDVNIEAVNQSRCTPFETACCFKNKKAMENLLLHDFNPNHTDSKYSTFLHRAVDDKSVEMTRILIKYGANLNFLNEYNQTPLQDAIYNMKYSKHGPNDKKNYAAIINILVSYGIKLETAGLKINDHHSKIICNDYIIIENFTYNIRNLKVKCEQEIEMMKEESIGINEITFYDLLKKNIYFLFKFFEFEKIQQLLELEIYNKKFPLYIDIVRSRFRQTKMQYKRRILMNSARELFSVNISSLLPDECIDAIFDNFSNEELKMFIKIMKPSNA